MDSPDGSRGSSGQSRPNDRDRSPERQNARRAVAPNRAGQRPGGPRREDVRTPELRGRSERSVDPRSGAPAGGRTHSPLAGAGRRGSVGAAGAGEAGTRRGRGDGSAWPGDQSRGGSRLAPKSVRLPEPAIPEGVTGRQLDRAIRAQLRTLSQDNAEGVGAHLVMVAQLLDTNIQAAEAHAETAVRRAGRVPATREALGLVAYRKGDWARALNEFRTARRLSGSSHLLALMVDCERALGRPDKALDLAASPEARALEQAERIELAIVVSGIRRDAGQFDAAAAVLEGVGLSSNARRPWTARLRYAYAEAKLAQGDPESARTWFSRAADADDELATDAAERLEELDGISYTDLLGDAEDGDSINRDEGQDQE